MRDYDFPQFKLFVSYWIDFLQVSAKVCRRYKKTLESNEVLGLFLIYTRYGSKFLHKHVSNTLFFLKAILPSTRVEKDEVHNHKTFTTRYLKRAIEKGLIVRIDTKGDHRVKMYEFSSILLSILKDVAKEFELQDRVWPTLLECQATCDDDSFIPNK